LKNVYLIFLSYVFCNYVVTVENIDFLKRFQIILPELKKRLLYIWLVRTVDKLAMCCL